MKKVIGLVALGLLLCASFALATETLDGVPISKGNVPRPTERTGSCVVTAVDDTANTISVWSAATWFLGDAHAMYIDPAADQDAAGGCSAPYYPFHVNSVDILFVELTDDTTEIGHTVTYEISFACPWDLASGSVTEDCHGPGSVFATYTVSHTLVRADFDENGIGGFISVNLPVDVCVDRPFFLIARWTGWDGVLQAPQIVWHRRDLPGATLDEVCDDWLYLATALAAPCWLLSGWDIGYGCTTPPPGHAACHPGSAFLFANGDAGVACTPVSACAARPDLYPGDDETDPLNVSTTPWIAELPMCDFTSDYNYYYDAGAAPTTARRFTGRGHDAVLDLNYSADPDNACFAVTLTPLCPPPLTFFRLRTWIEDSFGPLYWGTPQYPGNAGVQTYNFTPGGLGCQFPDRYLLFIDSYPCCCPLRVEVSGDLPLPVDLVSLSATPGDGVVNLSWVTRAESGVDVYAIQRNGVEIIVDGLGDSPTGHTYRYEDRDVVNGTRYVYHLVAHNVDGSATVFGQTAEATPSATPVVTEYALLQNFPNPFNPSSSITYSVKEAGSVKLTVYSVDGREVVTLVDDVQEANVYTVDFNGTSFASGVYLYKLEVNGFTDSKKMVLMK